MLATLNDVLLPARKGGYAVGMFDTINFEMARGVLAAAELTGSPVIIGTAETLLPCGPLDEVSYFLIPMARKARVPVAVHYDHGLTFEKCMEALELGFTSIMYDCSTDSYEENVRKVKEMTGLAHAKGVTVEAELGHVGGNEGDSEATDYAVFYTDPAETKDFVKRTGVDALAIAVGTVHGAYRFAPKLDFERIETIKNTIEVPLVLHGGSGLSDEDFARAIRCGISKINIFTDVNTAALEGIQNAFRNGKKVISDCIPDQVQAITEATIKKMKLFGCTDQY